MYSYLSSSWFFFFNDTATTEIYTLSLHDALPIFVTMPVIVRLQPVQHALDDHHAAIDNDTEVHRAHRQQVRRHAAQLDRKSTRLNSSHANISYAVFCLKKKKQFYKSFSGTNAHDI